MMRGIMLFLLCVSVLYGIDIKPKRESIIEAKPKSVSFAANGLKVGQSGIILTHKNGYNVIIASTTITRIKDNIAYAEYEPFESIAQKYLPTPTFEPTQGDEVLIGGFYNKAIAIAPNQNNYNQILSYNESAPTHERIQFIHIDMFAAFLAKDGINDPKHKHFKEFCNIYSVGLVYIFASNGINILDCQSFALLEEVALPQMQIESTSAPFFSRIDKIDTGSLASKLRSKKSQNYFSYYDNLLEPSLKAFHLTHKE